MTVQQKKIDALEKDIAQARGNKKIILLNTLTRELVYDEPRRALEFAVEAHTLGLNLLRAQWKKDGREGDHTDTRQVAATVDIYPVYISTLAESCLQLGRCYTLLSESTTAEALLLQALELYTALQNIDKQLETFYALLRMHLRAGTYRAGMDYCVRGLELCEAASDPERVFEMMKGMADVSYTLSKHEDALVYYQRALELIESAGIEERRSSILEGFALAYSALGRREEALEFLKHCLELRRSAGDRRGEANVLLHMGGTCWEMGDYQASLDRGAEALAICEEIEDHLGICHLLGNIANVYLALGSFEIALEHYSRQLKVAESIGYTAGQASALEGLAMVYTEWGEYIPALDYCHRVLELYEKNHDTLGVAGIIGNMGVLFEKMGDTEKAYELLHRFLLDSRQIGYLDGEILAFYNLGNMYYRRMDYEQALHHYSSGLAISEKMQIRPKTYQGWYLLGRTYSSQGRVSEAMEFLQRALGQAIPLNEKEHVLFIHRELSKLYEGMGDYERTHYHYKEYHRVEKEIFNEQTHARVKKLQMLHQVENAEKEKEIYRITNEKLQQENEMQKKELASKAMYISQKNELLNKIKRTLRTLATNVPSDTASSIRSVVGDIEATLADEQTWGMFEEQFQKIQQPFMQALADGYPTLSPLEVRVCALIRLNLSSKEISRILNVAPRSIEMYRYRIRKKLGIDQADNLNAFLMRL